MDEWDKFYEELDEEDINFRVEMDKRGYTKEEWESIVMPDDYYTRPTGNCCMVCLGKSVRREGTDHQYCEECLNCGQIDLDAVPEGCLLVTDGKKLLVSGVQ